MPVIAYLKELIQSLLKKQSHVSSPTPTSVNDASRCEAPLLTAYLDDFVKEVRILSDQFEKSRQSSDDQRIAVSSETSPLSLVNRSVSIAGELSEQETIRRSIENACIEGIPIKSLLKCIFGLFQYRAKANQTEFFLDFSPSFPEWVDGFQTAITQTLLMVVDNAVQATWSGRVTMTCLFEADTLVVNVSDTGEGNSLAKELRIGPSSEENCEDGIDKNKRTGLLIACRLVRELSGTLQLKSEPRLGNNVTIRIPVKRSQRDHQSDRPRANQDPLSRVLAKGLAYLKHEVGALYIALEQNRKDRIGQILHGMKGFPAGFGLKAVHRKLEQFEELFCRQDTADNDLLFCLDQLATTIEDLSLRFDEKDRENTPNGDEGLAVLDNTHVRILVAEDNHMNQDMIAYMLQSLGFSFSMVSNGCEALEALENSPYDLMLLDIHMPEMGGTETIKTLRMSDKWAGLPVIAVTAQHIEDDEQRIREAGCDDFIAKPIDINELSRKIDRLLEGSIHWA